MRTHRFPMRLLLSGAGVAIALAAMAELSDSDARAYIKQGALVVDVRTVEEFREKHLPGVTNIPLAELKQRLPGIITNRSAVVLLHCQSGGRSGKAEAQLRDLGYTNAFNIGSFARAGKILKFDR